jgi:hypothetical protein
MGFKIREMSTEGKFCQALTVEALSRAIPPDTIRGVLQQTVVGQTGERKLSLPVVVWLVIALHVYTTLPMGAVLAKLACGLRLLWPDPLISLPTESSITYRRYQVGARPLARLFRQVCQPMATPETRGAFLFGLRLMALDGTREDVSDTPANAAAFGRHTSDRGASAFPQVQAVYLVECGTHAIVDACCWPDQRRGSRLVRSDRRDCAG